MFKSINLSAKFQVWWQSIDQEKMNLVCVVANYWGLAKTAIAAPRAISNITSIC